MSIYRLVLLVASLDKLGTRFPIDGLNQDDCFIVEVRIPRDVGHDSMLIADSIPNLRRTPAGCSE